MYLAANWLAYFSLYMLHQKFDIFNYKVSEHMLDGELVMHDYNEGAI